jgi:Sulfotransferase domain
MELPMRLPDFVLIGAMKKSGTTTLHQQLSLQSGIFMSEPKEPTFFSDDQVYAKGLDWYSSLFAVAATSDLCGESSTHYTKLPSGLEKVGRTARSLN